MKADEIKKLRAILEINQEEFALILGISKTSLARYEMKNGVEPKGDVLEKLNFLKENIVNGDGALYFLSKEIGASSLIPYLAMRAALKSYPILFKTLPAIVGQLQASTNALMTFSKEYSIGMYESLDKIMQYVTGIKKDDEAFRKEMDEWKKVRNENLDKFEDDIKKSGLRKDIKETINELTERLKV